jgi:hypothetical protein
MFDKTRSDSAQRISQLENQISVLTEMARPPQPTSYQDTFHPDTPPAVPTPPSPSDLGLTEEQIEELGGQDFIDLIAKVSAGAAASELASVKSELAAVKETQSDTLDDIFYGRLSELSPQWREINRDERFNQWLNQPDGLSGIARASFLTNAYDQRDADTAARYFNQFAALLPGAPDLNPDVLTDFIPDAAGGGRPSTDLTAGKPIYTPAGIQQFFKDRGLGKFKGREDEAAAIERDIFAAQKEGRIMLAGGRKSA